MKWIAYNTMALAFLGAACLFILRNHDVAGGFTVAAGEKPANIVRAGSSYSLLTASREPLKIKGETMQTVTIKDDDDLYVHGKATDHIWCMEDSRGLIGIRFDCGDSGTLYLTQDQALDLADQLRAMTALTPTPAKGDTR